MKSEFFKIAFKIIFLLLILIVVFLIIPEHSFIFKQKPIENQQQLGDQIIASFKDKNTSTDTIFLATERRLNLDCGTGVKYSLTDRINYKCYMLTHRYYINTDDAFVLPLIKTDKIVLTKIITYVNQQIPNDSDYMLVNEKTITGLKSKNIKIFLLNFDSIKSEKVEVTFTDYLKNSAIFHFTFVLENGKWSSRIL